MLNTLRGAQRIGILWVSHRWGDKYNGRGNISDEENSMLHSNYDPFYQQVNLKNKSEIFVPDLWIPVQNSDFVYPDETKWFTPLSRKKQAKEENICLHSQSLSPESMNTSRWADQFMFYASTWQSSTTLHINHATHKSPIHSDEGLTLKKISFIIVMTNMARLDYLVKKTFKERFQVSQHVRKLPPDLQKNNRSTNSWKIHKRI